MDFLLKRKTDHQTKTDTSAGHIQYLSKVSKLGMCTNTRVLSDSDDGS